MGWKALKKHFGIEHHVTVEKDCINIGSGYVHDLVVINTKTGRVVENSTFHSFLTEHYPELKKASAEKVLELINTEDVFLKSLSVYTYNYDGEILEKKCEKFGYPNVTHDGLIMNENTFSKDKSLIIERAKGELEIAVKWAGEAVDNAKKELTKQHEELVSRKSSLQKLTEKHLLNTTED